MSCEGEIPTAWSHSYFGIGINTLIIIKFNLLYTFVDILY